MYFFVAHVHVQIHLTECKQANSICHFVLTKNYQNTEVEIIVIYSLLPTTNDNSKHCDVGEALAG